MKNFLILFLTLLFTNFSFAEIKVPGSGGINYWYDFEKFYKKQLQKSQKKKKKLIFYGSTGEGGWATGFKIVKDINLNVLYFSRLKVPYGFRKKNRYLNKHLSIKT